MAAKLEDIGAFMTEAGLKYATHDDYIGTSFATEFYRDQDGDPSLFIIARLDEDGEYFRLLAPNLYHYPPDGQRKSEVFRVLLSVCWRSKLIKFEYDERDGEIRAIVEFPLEDSVLTSKQYLRCLNGLVQLIDEYHPAIAGAMEGSETTIEDAEEASDILRQADTLYAAAGIDRKRPAAARNDLRLEE